MQYDPHWNGCDGCGWFIRSAVIVSLPNGGMLAYCHHCRDLHFEALTELGAVIVPLD